MEKKIKRYGNAVIISLSSDDMEKHEIDVGDFIEFTITKVIKQNKK